MNGTRARQTVAKSDVVAALELAVVTVTVAKSEVVAALELVVVTVVI